ncbi:ATP-grasp fold amidoligase family protein [Bacillus sp. AFS055030]|uniref:ATP-grasp fold amidoligase family protein n=1 Tax=Bacillus sp. AFS055030 TaxID=2033507 RepID=UPI000BFB163B|nr:ATP-grasp fold amidoligase family protein [Bacillus sp. AFS055030]PGL72702.1 glycosyl transferase [Bacillus sp. AFS055030]
MKVLKKIKDPKKIALYIKWKLDKAGFFNFWNDETYLKFVYRLRMGKRLNLANPQSFNEKMQWLKLYDRNPRYSLMVDKYAVKTYVEEMVGPEYIIPTIGVYDKFEDIDFSQLPNRFVIKCTHNSGGVVVVNDKKDIDIKKIEKDFKRMLKRNFFYAGREWPYKNVPPRIIIEENLQDENEKIQINDYKLMCFNGELKCSFVCSNRNSKQGLCVNFYDEDWLPMPFERHYPRNSVEIEKPSQYEKMVQLAKILSKDIPFVRVDFYQKGEQVYFGELTFYPGSGAEEFTPEIWDYKLGQWINLSTVSQAHLVEEDRNHSKIGEFYED